MPRLLRYFCSGIVCLSQACSETSFRGESTPQPALRPVTPYPSATPFPTPSLVSVSSSKPIPTLASLPFISPTPKPGIVQPDGITLFDKCQACIDGASAKTQSFQASFIASKGNALSLGNYKNPIYCDIHFFRNLAQSGEPGIAEHSAAGGKIENSPEYPDQVIVYCPCNCNWNTPF